jgi:hypothetical protein
MVNKTIWEFLEEEPRWGKKTKELYEWSMNYETFEPFRKFLDLIGYTEDNYGESLGKWDKPSLLLGYKELGFMAEAMLEYADNPSEVLKYIDDLLELEANK